MKVLKDDKYKLILSAAHKEFIDKGFKEASMRNIAREAKVLPSNIYNYFKNKNELFLTIVKPAKDELYAFTEQHHKDENADFNQVSTFSYLEEEVEAYIQVIYKHKAEIRIMLYHSEGSSLENFRDSFTDYLTSISKNQIKQIRQNYPQTTDISDFFIHAQSSWMVSILGEIVTHNLSKKKVREFFREFFKFEIAGWKELTGI